MAYFILDANGSPVLTKGGVPLVGAASTIKLIEPANRKDLTLKAQWIASDGRTDREGDSIDAAGWKLEDYNGAGLYAHDHRGLTIFHAKAWVDGGRLLFEPRFAEHDFARIIFDMYANEIMNSFSVGFKPLEWKETETGYRFLVQDLFEISAVPVPANPNARVALGVHGLNPEDWTRRTRSVKGGFSLPAWQVEGDEGRRIKLWQVPMSFLSEEAPSAQQVLRLAQGREEPGAAQSPSPSPSQESRGRGFFGGGVGDQLTLGTMERLSRQEAQLDEIGRTIAALQEKVGISPSPQPEPQPVVEAATDAGTSPPPSPEGGSPSPSPSPAPEGEAKGVIPYKQTPKAPEDEAWDSNTEVSAASVDDLKIMSTWYDERNPDVKSSYKLPHHKQAGDHAVVWRAVANAFSRLSQTELSEADRRGVYNHLAKHAKDDFGKEPPDFKALEDLGLRAVVETLMLDREQAGRARGRAEGYVEGCRDASAKAARLIQQRLGKR